MYTEKRSAFVNEAVYGYFSSQVGSDPPDGWFVVWTKNKGIFPFHTSDIESMSCKIGELQQLTDVYVGMALQKTKPEPGKRGTGANTAAICGIWIEIDCREGVHKEKPENLPVKEQALGILKGLPVTPTVILDSGGGFHAHWWFDAPLVFNTDEERQRGQELVRSFQYAVADVFRDQGYKVDTTSDLARVLRPPHTFNHKSGTPVQVEVLHYDAEARYTVEQLEAYCQPVAPPQVASTAPLITLPGHAVQSGLNHTQYPPVEFQSVIDGCAWLRHCRDDAANLAQPEWYGAISIVARCKNGHAHSHALSKPYPGYNTGETDKKIADSLKNAGPRTCQNIRTALGGEPFCATCPSWAKVKSPIVLGHPSGQAMIPEILEELLHDAPIPAGIVTPAGYRISMDKGVVRLEEVKDKIIEVPVCPVPVLLASRSHDLVAATEFVEVVWYKDGRWNTRIVPRRVIADTREILVLCDFGLPVTSIRAKVVVAYLDAFEVANELTIPLIKSSASLGWQSDEAFLWGETLLMPSGRDNEEQVLFRPQDAGDEQVATGFHARGDLAEWVGLVNGIYVFAKVFAMVMAALSTPFLRIMRAANFIVDLAGETSKGKSSALRLCAAAWGNPDERSKTSALYTWDATDVWFERTAALLNGLPMILDDSKNARSSDVIGDFIYRFVSGKGKGRGSLTGTRETGSWESILLSTGEQSAVDYAKGHGGAKGRVLSLWGTPFGEGDQAQMVQELNMTVKANYGHAGPKVVQFILDHEEDWPLWRTAHREMLSLYAEKTGGVGGVATRLSEIFAFLATTIPLIHAALPDLKPSRPIADILDEIWPSVMQGAQQADLATEALKALWSWAVSNQAKFYGRHKLDAQGSPVEPHQGWAGRWDKPPKWGFLALTRATLDGVIGHDFEVAAMIKTWADRGWLLRDTRGKGLQKTVKIGGAATGAYVFQKPTLAKVLELDLDDIDKCLGDDPLLS